MADNSKLKIYTEDRSLSVECSFYQDAPTQAGGGGGYVPVQRPQDSAFTAWQGPTDGFHLVLNLILDGFDKGHTVEAGCRTIDKMYGAVTTPMVQPPLLILDAGGWLQYDAVNYPKGRWVIAADPSFSSTNGDVVRNSKGLRTRQVYDSVDFMLFTPFDAVGRSLTNSQSAPAGVFVASTGVDTFKKAAAFYLKSYGGASLGNRLATLNGKSDPTATLPPGSGPYLLPSAAQIAQWKGTPRR